MRVRVSWEQLELQPRLLDHPDAVRLVDEVQTFYADLYGGPDTGPIDPQEMAPPDGAFFVGYLEQRPVLMGGWRFPLEPIAMDARCPAEIKRMYVVPDLRGNGLARALLGHLELSAATAGADAVVLETGRPQVAAVALYRACGFIDIPRFGHYKNEPDAVHLGKVITTAEAQAG